MDIKKYIPNVFLKVDHVKASGAIRVKVTGISEGQYDKPNLAFNDGSQLSLNATNCRTLARAYGTESDDWIGKEVELTLGEIQQKAILVKPISPPIENKASPKDRRLEARSPEHFWAGPMPQVIPSIIQIAEIMGGGVTGAEALVPGPGHSPEDRSLAIKLDSAAADGFVVHSFADDDPIACRDFVKKKLGLPEFIPKKKTSNGGGRPFSPTVAKYVYRLADDTPCLQVQWTAAKEFFQYHWDGENWITGKPKGPKIPYMLPQLIAAAPTAPIYVVEGEKDADNLAKIGFVATCNSEGADNGSGSKWTYDLNQYFKDRHVYIIPDNDALEGSAKRFAGLFDLVLREINRH